MTLKSIYPFVLHFSQPCDPSCSFGRLLRQNVASLGQSSDGHVTVLGESHPWTFLSLTNAGHSMYLCQCKSFFPFGQKEMKVSLSIYPENLTAISSFRKFLLSRNKWRTATIACPVAQSRLSRTIKKTWQEDQNCVALTTGSFSK